MDEKKYTLSHLPTLDGLRALAITSVLISHSSKLLFGANGIWSNSNAEGIVTWGRLGVDLFFALSGFLITYRLLAEQEKNGRISLRDFYLRRVFRIFPPYFFYLTVLVVLSMFGIVAVAKWEILASIFFVRNYFMYYWTSGGLATNHFWSLAVEEHFYLLWPSLLIVLLRRKWVWITPIIAMVIYGWLRIDTKFHIFGHFFPDAGTVFRTDTRLDALLWGCFAAIIFPEFQQLVLRFPIQSKIAQFFLPCFLITGIAKHLPFLQLWLALIFPAFLLVTVTQPKNIFGIFLSLSPVSCFGRLSYSIYIWQTLFLNCEILSPISNHHNSSTYNIMALIVNFLCILTIACFSYYFIEQPSIKWGRNFIKAKSQRHISF